MRRKLTPQSTLETLKREAKRWLKALRENDTEARARFESAYPKAPTEPTLRDVQHALALEHGLEGWVALKAAVESNRSPASARDAAIVSLLDAAGTGDSARVARAARRVPGHRQRTRSQARTHRASHRAASRRRWQAPRHDEAAARARRRSERARRRRQRDADPLRRREW